MKHIKNMYEERQCPQPTWSTPKGAQEVGEFIIKIMFYVFFVAFIVHIITL